MWKVETNTHRKFYEHWRRSSASSDFRVGTFPYPLSLGTKAGSAPFMIPRGNSTFEDNIVVTQSHDDMFHRLLRLRTGDNGGRKGAVLTGQPGIGMSP